MLTNKLGSEYRVSLINTTQNTFHSSTQWEATNSTHHQPHNNRCNMLSVQYTQWNQFSGPQSSNVPSQQFELSKDTFRWTFEWAKINFNRLKILIFPVNNQETFPVGGQANQSLWEEVRVVQRGIWCGSQSTTLLSAFCCPFYI